MSLSIALRRFNRLINPPQFRDEIPDQPQVAAVELGRKRTYRSRSARSFVLSGTKPVGSSDDFLTLQQVEAIYDAASFLPQQYGVLFNAHLRLRHGALGAAGPQEVTDLVSKITHQICLRVRGWSGKEAHWLYLNASDTSGPVTDMILHIPGELLPRAKAWFGKVMKEWRDAKADQDSWSLSMDDSGAMKVRVSRHWRLIRLVLRGIDPQIEHWASPAHEQRIPLGDLLRVPRTLRAPLGKAAVRRYGTSAGIGPSARATAQEGKMKLLSPFVDSAWKVLDSGWELKEARERQAEAERREQQRRYLDERFPVSSDPILQKQRLVALDALLASWPDDPRERRRNSSGWQWWLPTRA